LKTMLGLVLFSFLPSVFCDPNLTIAENIAQMDDLSSLNTLITSQFSEIEELLKGDGPLTIFAPNNGALLAAATILASNPDQGFLESTIRYHGLDKIVSSSDVTQDRQYFNTLLTDAEYVSLPDNAGQVIGVYLDGDTVKLVGGDPNADIQVISADVEASNGMIHVIDTVLTIPPDVSTLLSEEDQLSAFQERLNDVNLLEEITEQDGMTLFAPNDDAFDNAPNNLSDDELEEVLQYHYIPDETVYEGQVTDNMELSTDEGSSLTLSKDGDQLQVNNNQVVTSDLLVKNGVVHVVDSVMVPGDVGSSAISASLPRVLLLSSCSIFVLSFFFM